jgi:hypothetical protein
MRGRTIALGGLMLAGVLGLTAVGEAKACTSGEAKYAGLYTLNGVMEVGSQLLLNQDGSFEFMLAYGANDQYGKGCWIVKGNRLEVIPEGRGKASTTHTPEERSFGGLVLTISGRDLIWNINNSGHKGTFEKN